MPVNNVSFTQSNVWAQSLQNQQLKKWYIFYTKPKAELIAEELLVKDGFEVYLPKINQSSIWKNRQKKIIVKPLIASYIFVYMPEHQIEKVLANPKIVTVITCGEKKAVLREEDMKLLQKMARLRGKISATSDYKVGKRVRFVEGSFTGLEGQIINHRGKQRFGIELDALHYAVFIDLEMDQSQIEIISG